MGNNRTKTYDVRYQKDKTHANIFHNTSKTRTTLTTCTLTTFATEITFIPSTEKRDKRKKTHY